MTEIIEEISTRLAEQHAACLEREVLGAWMAGYDYLHHCQRPAVHSFGAKERYVPSNNERPKHHVWRPESSWSVQVYDLRWLFPDDVEAYREVGVEAFDA